MKIYWIPTHAPRRVAALVKHLNLPVDFVQLDLKAAEHRAPAYAALNPNMKAPTLVDGDFVLWESAAIMTYLAGKAGSDMWPRDNPREQADIVRWFSWNNSHWQPFIGHFYFEYLIKPILGLGAADENLLKSKTPELLQAAKLLDDHLAGKVFVACGRLTVADFQLASMACSWREARMPLEDFAHLTRWLEGLMRIPAWSNPWPERKAA